MNNLTHSEEERKDLFIKKSREKHGNKYDYSKVVYKNAREKVEIGCPTHGYFFQVPDTHSKGFGCRQCGLEKSSPKGFSIRKTNEQYLQECINTHGDRYDYSKTNYISKKDQVIITCKNHGDFSQKAENHRNGAGCPTCGVEKAHSHFRKDTSFFIEQSIEIHGNKYDYSCSNYVGKARPISIRCKEHGIFTLERAMYHYTASCMGCPRCSTNSSLMEKDLVSFVESLGVQVITGDRKLIKPLELDIVLPDFKIAIEFNGLFWHSEKMGKAKNYHLNKLNAANKAGYRLIQIFEDEWVNKKEIVKSRLAHILGKSLEQKFFARKLTIRDVNRKEAYGFLETRHIQGPCSFSKGYGLYNGENLVALMTFGKNRFTSDGGVELIRYATKGNIVGGFSRLMTRFLKDFPEVTSVVSYSDRRWSEGTVYEKNGFQKVGSSIPSYFYFKSPDLKRLNRVHFQKHKLRSFLPKFNPNISEVKNMEENGYMRIFDCGTDKWEYKRS